MIIPIRITSLEHSSECAVRMTIFTDLAKRKFDVAYARSWFYKVWALLTRRSSRMLDLKKVKATASIRNRHYQGIRTVPLDQIRGSENRADDFDAHFNPVRLYNRLRWVNVATAMLQDIILPPVELIKLGDTYFVRDGHHRISAARALGQKDIEAIVTKWTVN